MYDKKEIPIEEAAFDLYQKLGDLYMAEDDEKDKIALEIIRKLMLGEYDVRN